MNIADCLCVWFRCDCATCCQTDALMSVLSLSMSFIELHFGDLCQPSQVQPGLNKRRPKQRAKLFYLLCNFAVAGCIRLSHEFWHNSTFCLRLNIFCDFQMGKTDWFSLVWRFLWLNVLENKTLLICAVLTYLHLVMHVNNISSLCLEKTLLVRFRFPV